METLKNLLNLFPQKYIVNSIVIFGKNLKFLKK